MTYCNQLNTPPLLPNQNNTMQSLEMRGTPLTSLPPNLLQLPQACNGYMSFGRLAESVRRKFAAAREALPAGEGPRIYYDMTEQGRALPAVALHTTVNSWMPSGSSNWQGFVNHESAPAFQHS